MKNIILLSALFLLGLQSCDFSSQNEVELVTPKQVYEAIYGSKEIAGVQLLDVRTSKEFAVSHLKNAQNICITSDDFKEKVATLDKEKPIYVYCKAGGRSANAATILKQMGFTKVYDLQGGIMNWETQGLDLIH